MAETIEKKLYNGKIEIIFYPKSHKYRMKGKIKYLVSVTRATGIVDASRPLMMWAVGLTVEHLQTYLENSKVNKFTKEELWPVIEEARRQHSIRKEQAASIGSQVHDFAEYFAKCKLEGKDAEFPKQGETSKEDFEKVMAGINAFLDWYNKNNVIFKETEKFVYSRKHEFCGMLDALAEVNGVLTVIDYKTSKRIYSPHRYQVAAYRGAYEEEFPKQKIKSSLILHFDKETGECHQLELNQDKHDIDYQTFLACLAVKKREKELSK